MSPCHAFAPVTAPAELVNARPGGDSFCCSNRYSKCEEAASTHPTHAHTMRPQAQNTQTPDQLLCHAASCAMHTYPTQPTRAPCDLRRITHMPDPQACHATSNITDTHNSR
eukprot:352374-Chlamydomonas_euryale.AAC.6